MTYAGAALAAESRTLLGSALEALQRDPNIPRDVMAVAENIAGAVGALFEAEKASSDLDGKASVKHAMGSLSQTMALLQDVKSNHEGISTATSALAQVMSKLYPLSVVPTVRPGSSGGIGSAKTIVNPAASTGAGGVAHPGTRSSQPPRSGRSQPPVAAKPVRPAARPAPAAQPRAVSGPRERLEANVGATTESNFFVGFSGEIAEGGVFIATYATLSLGAPVEVLVTLPGNYQFTVAGHARFVRDPMDMDSEPGIGVRVEALPTEHRELILRFVRKRPPLFYDE
jgi:uncharacterized protein (TIGR02266 family)